MEAPENCICVNRSGSVGKTVSQMKRLTYTRQPIDGKKCGGVIGPQTLLTLPVCNHFVRSEVALRECLLLVSGVGECGIVVFGVGVRRSCGVF